MRELGALEGEEAEVVVVVVQWRSRSRECCLLSQATVTASLVPASRHRPKELARTRGMARTLTPVNCGPGGAVGGC